MSKLIPIALLSLAACVDQLDEATELDEATVASCAPERAAGAVPPFERALLDLIATTEGTRGSSANDGYDIAFGFHRFASCETHPGQVFCEGTLCSSASGRYQFLKGTWDGLGYPTFHPDLQDIAAMRLVREKRGASVPANRALTFAEFSAVMDKISFEWASLPPGRYGQPSRTLSQAWTIYSDLVTAVHPAAPAPTDVYAVDQHGGSGHTEVHALAHGSSFTSFSLHAATALGPTDASWQLLFGDYNRDGKTDLYAIRKAGGGSDHTEVHILDGADNYHSFLLHAASALGETGNDGRWQFQLADYNNDGKLDLFAINRQGTGTSSTEVHVLNGANNFASFLLHTGSALGMTDSGWTMQVADYNSDGHPDVYAIKSSTASTEVHVLDGARGFDSFLLRKVTALGATASPSWNLRIGQLAGGKPDLFAIKTSDSNATEVHVLDGDSSFQTFSLHRVSALGPVGTGGWAFDAR